MNLSSLTQSLQKYLRMFEYGERVRPYRDWIYIIGLAFVLLVASAGWSYGVFERTSNEELTAQTQGAAAGGAVPSPETVRRIFDVRAIERSHYLSDYHFVDPSR